MASPSRGVRSSSDPVLSMNGTSGAENDWRKFRLKHPRRKGPSCTSCRKRKVRCVQGDLDAKCAKCEQFNERCVFEDSGQRTQVAGQPELKDGASSILQEWSALFAVPSDSTTSGDRLPSFVSDISSQLLYDLPLPPTDLSFGNPLAVRELSADAHIVRLEDVTDMQTVTALIHGYRVHLYALTPIVHWPTFAQDLLSREDQRSVSWLALLLSLMAYSIVQLPWSALAFAPVTKLRALHAQCYRVSDRLLLTHEPELSLLGMSARYLHHVYLSTTGTINGYLEEVVRAAQKQHLYKEPPEEGEVVDQEIRRRLWWLLYASDRTISVLHAIPFLINDLDIRVSLPAIINDSHLSPSVINTSSHLPILAGNYYSTRLFLLISSIVTAERNLDTEVYPDYIVSHAERGVPKSPEYLMDLLDQFLAALPSRLQVPMLTSNESTQAGSHPEVSANGQFSMTGSEGDDEAGFAACRANLIITSTLARSLIGRYARRYSDTRGEDLDLGHHLGRGVEINVLRLLESIPSQSLVANGMSLRSKLLALAAYLLDQSPSVAMSAPFLTGFLGVFSKISQEQNTALLGERG